MFIIKSEKFQFQYVPVPKNACTSIKEFIYSLDNNGDRFQPYTNEFGKKIWIHDYYFKKGAQGDIRKGEFSFAIVRDPIKRFLSAYENRVLGHNELSEEHLRKDNSLKPTPDIHEFIRNFKRYYNVSESIMHHFKPQSFFIDKPEDLNKIYFSHEIPMLEKDLSSIINDDVSFPRLQTSGKSFKINDLNTDEVNFIISMYKDDYELLKKYKGYDLSDSINDFNSKGFIDKNSESMHYNRLFYNDQVSDSLQSAEHVFSELFSYFKPNSIIDFGCGAGAWLSVAKNMGIENVLGVDGLRVKDSLMLSQEEFQPHNFHDKFDSNVKYDLAISVEVAEHINEEYVENFIESITNSSDLVLFSAAIPGQGGTNHINEKPQSYWIKLFKKKGFTIDYGLRNFLWDNESVKYWYRQNILFFIREGHSLLSILKRGEDSEISDVVHPQAFLNLNKLKLDNNEIDLIRDVAIKIGSENVDDAIKLLEIAKKYRPNGGLINEKLKEFYQFKK